MTFDLDIPWSSSRFAAFDLETTGREAGVDRIIEIGIVVFEDGEVVDRYQSLVDPEVELPEVITQVTGIKPEELVGQPKLADIIDEVMRRLTAQPLLAYNAEFDLGMLRGELDRLGRTDELPPCIDPFPFCWEHLREKGHTKNAQLGTVSEYLGIPLEAAHRADHDAEACGRVMLELPNHVILPDTLKQLLDVQRVLMQKVNERFARFRRGRSGEKKSSVLGSGELVIELGAAYIYGDEHDPLRAIYSRIPDVRDL